MGAIRKLIQDFDGTNDMIKEQNAHLDTLSELAKVKADLFNEKIELKLANAGTGIDKTIPISQVQDSIYETHAYTSNSSTEIAKTVTTAIKGFVSGGKENVTNGISSLITAAIKGLFGDESAEDLIFEKYYVILEGAALVRLDMMGWKRSIKASALSERIEQVSAFVLYKSSVSLKEVSFNTFLDFYQVPILADNPDAKLIDIVSEAKEIYKSYKDMEEKVVQKLEN